MSSLHRTNKYDDMIDLPHHVSKTHPPMDIMDRAAQFNPFAALTGYDDEIREAARFTCEKILLAEDEKRVLDKKLQGLMQRIHEHPELEVTYFIADEKKTGGVYQTLQGVLKKIDAIQRTLVLMDGTRIEMQDILRLESRIFDGLPEAEG